MSLLRTLATVSYLRPVQVFDRLARTVRGVPAPPMAAGYRLRQRRPEPPCPRPPAFTGRGFRFLNRSVAFAGSDRWDPPGTPLLWRYNLHYFGYLSDLDPVEGRVLVLDWIAANPPGRGPGWQPYPLSLRIREWLEWLLATPDLEGGERALVVASLASQLAALEDQLEYHLLGNHLLENAITLCWGGLTLGGPAAPRWLDRGLALLKEELAVQLLPDGAHDERSPMYQGLLAEALLRLAVVAGASPGPAAAAVAGMALSAGELLVQTLALLEHPDGRMALLNDSAFGIAPSTAALRARFGRMPAGSPCGPWALPDAGYLGWRRGGAYLVLDAGPLGPDHQPGHGHADLLSCELSLGGHRLLTDTGVSTYEPGPERAYQRGTSAHNTLTVDGRDQAELWGAFRCGRRPSVEPATVRAGGGGAVLSGAYTTPAGVRHRRRVAAGDAGVRCADRVEAAGSHRARLRLHLDPAVQAQTAAGSVRLQAPGAPPVTIEGRGFEWEVTRSPYHPELGVTIDRACLEATIPFHDELAVEWRLTITPGA